MVNVDENNNKQISQQQLAVERTHLANERTLLAYLRTSLAMIGFGALIWRFDVSPHAGLYGLAIVTVAVIIVVVGIIRFFHFRKKITRAR